MGQRRANFEFAGSPHHPISPSPHHSPDALRLALYTFALPLALTGAYLAGPAHAWMGLGTTALVLAHAGMGILLAPAVFWAVHQRLRCRKPDDQTSCSPDPRRRSSALLAAGYLLLAASWLAGISLIVVAARGGTAKGTVVGVHAVAGFTALALGGVMSRVPPLRSFAPSVAAVLLLIALPAAFSAMTAGDAVGNRYEAEAYYAHLTATNARQAGNPLFPAGTSVSGAPGAWHPSSTDCGSAGCHSVEYRQWRGSVHHGAEADPFYRRAAELFARQRGEAARRWCEGCHGPAAAARRQTVVSSGTSLPSLPSADDRLRSEAGVDCITCHAAVRVAELSGNGRFELRLPSSYPFAASRDPRLRWVHQFFLHLRPGPHRAALLVPALHRRSEFCAACHRMSYNVAQNQYKFLRASDEYGTWQAGTDSGESVHGFYPPGPLRRCQDCHAPHGGPVDGTWYHPLRGYPVDGPTMSGSAGPSTINYQPSTGAKRVTPTTGAVTVDVLALRRVRVGQKGTPRSAEALRQQGDAGPDRTGPSGSGLSSPDAREELIAPLERAAPLLRPGEVVTVDVVVRNRGVGHEFPAGVSDLKDVWLEFEVADAAGRVLLCSGELGAHGDVAPGAHEYGLVALDREGRRLEHGDLWNMATPLYHRSILPGQPDADRRTIQPGESDVVRYRVQVPPRSSGVLKLRARLWYRRLRPAFVRWVAGEDGRRGEGARGRGGDSTTVGPEDRPVVPSPRPPVAPSPRLPSAKLVAEDQVTLPVATMAIRDEVGVRRRPRGPGTRGARGPGTRRAAGGPWVDPTPGITDSTLPGRFYDYGVGLLLQGDLPRAQRAMRRVQAWAPGDGRGYLGLGRVYLAEGDLLAARAQFEQARRLAPIDPRPRAFLATTERKMGEYDRALALLEPLTRSYPRDRLLWFDLGMSCYQAGRFEEAARAFETLLGIDPDDLAGHYNLMLCLRRLRRVPEARREEVIYQMLQEDDDARPLELSYLRRHPLADREARTIHEHPVRPVMRDE